MLLQAQDAPDPFICTLVDKNVDHEPSTVLLASAGLDGRADSGGWLTAQVSGVHCSMSGSWQLSMCGPISRRLSAAEAMLLMLGFGINCRIVAANAARASLSSRLKPHSAALNAHVAISMAIPCILRLMNACVCPIARR